ncbi:MAG: ABC transporter permease [Nitrospinae bacterium]|nr:ABC transporter permease [Nitrospinota bacterium]
MILIMAWRNLWRRKRRTLITSGTVAFGLLFSIIVTGAKDYGYTKMINTSASMGLGHVTVQPVGYLESPTLDKKFANATAVRDAVLATPGVTSAATRIIGQAMYSSALKSVGGSFIAIDSSRETAKTNLFWGALTEGRVCAKDAPEVVVGVRLAEKLNLKIGKKLVYTATGAHGELVSDMARVTGLFKTGIEEVDGSMAIMPLDRVRATLHYGKDEAGIMAVFISDRRNAGTVRDAVAERIGGGDKETLSWEKTQSEVAGMIRVNRVVNTIFQVFVGLIVAAGILDTILMSVFERKREFGVMLSVGCSPRRLFGLLIAESMMIGLTGLVLGLLLSAPVYRYLHTTGLDFNSWAPEGTTYEASGIPLDMVMKVDLYGESLAVIVAVLFLLTVAAGLYPALKASGVPPVESMKNV